ncbi:Pro-rich N-terminal domain-containing protein [Streptomyces silaceus]|uniref:Pro-rich N-terminal domain-containing protein n=1 Tax=Streptomyces silaceus TaxID=545123 RepID=UPI00099EC681|nr:Pro-rich N-terminal domain-containing protein [Streptomyces silaceus]MCF3119388.1 AAA family ATPase [Streptomyces arenae]
MQHAGGSPLPPPHQPGHGPATGWPQAAHHPGAPRPGAAPQGAPPPPAPGFVGSAPQAPGQAPQAPPAPGQAPPAPGQAPATLQLGRGPVPPNPDTTGHVQLPPGGPVAMPSPPQGTAQADTGATTLAVLLIGPAGAGKTSVAKYWAEHRRVPTAHISLDDVREWVRSGFADPQSGWNDHSEAQYRLARRTCGFAARNFLANGISCILDDAVFPDRPVVGLGGWKRHVGPGLLPVVLLPGLEIVLERNAERSGNRRLTDEEVARIHGRMAGWYGSGLPIIDNSQLDVPATAQVLDDVLARAIASPPTW